MAGNLWLKKEKKDGSERGDRPTCVTLKKNRTFNLSFTILSKQSYHHHSRVSTMWLEIIETGSPPEFTAKAKQSKSTLKNFGNTYS